MPWTVRKLSNGKYGIFKKNTGEKVGTSDSKEKAMGSMRARYMSEENPDMMGKKKHMMPEMHKENHG